MEIEIFTLADYATDPGFGKLTIIGTFDNLFAPSFPAEHPTAFVVARIRFANSEASLHRVEIRVLDTNGQNVHKPLVEDFDVKPNPNAAHTSYNIIWTLTNTRFEKAGVYAIEMHYDGEFRTGMKLTVALAPQANQ